MTQPRKDVLATGEFYHVFTKSIAGFIIFNGRDEFCHMQELMDFHRAEKPLVRFSWLNRFENGKAQAAQIRRQKRLLVRVVAYCLMPTHLHFFLQQSMDNGISIFMGKLLNSYTRYFNLKHSRKGPLWEGRFKNVLVKTDEQAIHLSRYIHLNPTSAGLVKRPEEWEYSSYHEYLSPETEANRICEYEGLFDMSADQYKKFVEGYRENQRELAIIKSMLVD